MGFLVKWPGDPEPLLGAIQVAKEIIAMEFELVQIGLANGISTYNV
jgi:hypothetical protein